MAILGAISLRMHRAAFGMMSALLVPILLTRMTTLTYLTVRREHDHGTFVDLCGEHPNQGVPFVAVLLLRRLSLKHAIIVTRGDFIWAPSMLDGN